MGGGNYKYVSAYELQCNPACLLYRSPNPPTLTTKSTSNVEVMYSIYRMNSETGPLIVGYEVFCFGVPMIGEYVNVGRNIRTVTISGAVQEES